MAAEKSVKRRETSRTTSAATAAAVRQTPLAAAATAAAALGDEAARSCHCACTLHYAFISPLTISCFPPLSLLPLPSLPPCSSPHLGCDLDARILGHELGGDGHSLVDCDAALRNCLVLFREVDGGWKGGRAEGMEGIEWARLKDYGSACGCRAVGSQLLPA